ncbi:hypothetical protein [Undibacterium sp. RuRC25W]|uniref:hypothetical protein n=1 Tax=Undibacterium sp. RuRC25W TaxID=3413047 RepID=UPI003BF36070
MKIVVLKLRRMVPVCRTFLYVFLGTVLLYENVAAQTPPVTEQAPPLLAQPLNPESRQVVKEISKELNGVDNKPAILTNSSSTTHDEFEKSLQESENRKRIFGVAEVGVSTGSIPAQRGLKGATVTCTDAAVAVTDQISKSTQISVAAEVDKCRIK